MILAAVNLKTELNMATFGHNSTTYLAALAGRVASMTLMFDLGNKDSTALSGGKSLSPINCEAGNTFIPTKRNILYFAL